MRKLFGVIVIIIGVLLLLNAMDIAGVGEIIGTWWPLVIIAIGILSWYSNRRIWFGPVIITLVGLILLLDRLDIFTESAWNYFWPVIIILIGAKLLMGRKWDRWNKPAAETSADANASVMFSGVDKRVTGEFSQGDVSAWFGGAKIDLREANFKEQTNLNTFAAFGGVEIIVPRHVRVVTKITPIFGGAEDKTRPENSTATLTISGTAMFGGIEIKN